MCFVVSKELRRPRVPKWLKDLGLADDAAPKSPKKKEKEPSDDEEREDEDDDEDEDGSSDEDEDEEPRRDEWATKIYDPTRFWSFLFSYA